MELTEITKLVDDGFKGIEGNIEGKVAKLFEKEKAGLIDVIEKKGYTSKEEVETLVKASKEELEGIILAVKKSAQTITEDKKSLGDLFADSIKENKGLLSNIASKKATNGSIMLKANEDLDPANFGTGAYAFETTDRQRRMYEFPFQPLWLRNVLPNTTATGSTIQYLRENGGVGAAGVWDGSGDIDALTEKPGTSSSFELITATIEWIAGITRVKREMLDDIAWLQGYLARQLTVGRRGLWVAENTLIYNTLTDAANSVVYNGDKTVPIEILYDAAFGQLKDNYYNPTTILMNHRDVVNYIALNKAEGSGEYDLPAGTVAVIGNQLILNGVPVIGVPNIPQGEFVVFDRNATEFVSRMSPEIRFFEQDRDNVPKNLITVRAEERVTTLVYDENAVITGSLGTT